MAKVLNIAVFASGRGTNARAILDFIDRAAVNARISLIISNKSDAGVFNIAKEYNIPHRLVRPTDENYVNDLLAVLDDHAIELIVLAGYLKKIPSSIISKYRNKIMNIHPALLPAFGGQGMYGMNVHRAVIEYGVKVSGATVHFVDEEYDHGPIIMQETVEVQDTDTPESLAAKVLAIEHRIYSKAVQLYADGKLKIVGRRVLIQHNKGN